MGAIYRLTDKVSLSFSAFLHTGKNNKHIIFVEADKS